MFNRRSMLVITAATCVFLPGAHEAAAQGDNRAIAALAGTWTGQQVRSNGLTRTMTIIIQPSGAYVWTAGDGFSTNGQLSGGAGGVISYANGAGSRGVVTRSGRQLVWKNTLTGNNYTVTVSR
jgi:hypothetical protein